MALIDNIFAYWKLDESSGNAADATGNGRTMVNVGSIGYGPGIINNGAIFVNDASKYLNDTSDNFSPGSSVFSINLWMKSSSLDVDRVYSMPPTTIGSRSFVDLDVNSNGTIAAEIAWVSGGNQGLGVTTPNVNWADGNWHMFTVVIDHSTSKARITIYFDGVQQAQATHASLDYNINVSLRSLIGATVNWSSGSVEGPFNGTIDEVGYWIGKALSSSEVTQLYNGGAGLQYPFTVDPDLIHLDQEIPGLRIR